MVYYDAVMVNSRKIWMLGGFAAAGTGDWLLAVKASPVGSSGFLIGVCCFALAHILWLSGQLREARPDRRVFVASVIPLLALSGVRLVPVLDFPTSIAIVLYSVISAMSLATAIGGRRRFYVLGILSLVVSDVMIGARMLDIPGSAFLVGSTYVLAECFLLVSFFSRNESRLMFMFSISALRNRVLVFGVLAACFFGLGMAVFPGGTYNPAMRMLSALGRTELAGEKWPLCHHFFVFGMVASAIATACAFASCRRHVEGVRRTVLDYGAAVNFAGLLTIAAVPENVSMSYHNVGCHLAAAGGGAALFALHGKLTGWWWTGTLIAVVSIFSAALVLHAAGIISFAPAVPTMQKLLIVSFAAWIARIATVSKY